MTHRLDTSFNMPVHCEFPDWAWPILWRDCSQIDFLADAGLIAEGVEAKGLCYFFQIVHFELVGDDCYTAHVKLWTLDPHFPQWNSRGIRTFGNYPINADCEVD